MIINLQGRVENLRTLWAPGVELSTPDCSEVGSDEALTPDHNVFNPRTLNLD